MASGISMVGLFQRNLHFGKKPKMLQTNPSILKICRMFPQTCPQGIYTHTLSVWRLVTGWLCFSVRTMVALWLQMCPLLALPLTPKLAGAEDLVDLCASVLQICVLFQCSHDGCSDDSPQQDEFSERYLRIMQQRAEFSCFYLASNPQVLIPTILLTSTDIAHFLFWPAMVALVCILCAFLLYCDPCGLTKEAQPGRTNLRRVSPRTLNKAKKKYEIPCSAEESVALRPIVRHVKQLRPKSEQGVSSPVQKASIAQDTTSLEVHSEDTVRLKTPSPKRASKENPVSSPKRATCDPKILSEENTASSPTRLTKEDMAPSPKRLEREKLPSPRMESPSRSLLEQREFGHRSRPKRRHSSRSSSDASGKPKVKKSKPEVKKSKRQADQKQSSPLVPRVEPRNREKHRHKDFLSGDQKNKTDLRRKPSTPTRTPSLTRETNV